MRTLQFTKKALILRNYVGHASLKVNRIKPPQHVKNCACACFPTSYFLFEGKCMIPSGRGGVRKGR